jgi:hypothetical protein
MIVPAIIIAILPDDRLHVEFKIDGNVRRCFTPHPLDMGPDAGVGSKVKVDYSDERGVERLLYLSPLLRPSTVEWKSMVVPAECNAARQSVDELDDPVKLAEDRTVFRMSEAEVDECLRARGLDPEEVGREGSLLIRGLLAEHRERSCLSERARLVEQCKPDATHVLDDMHRERRSKLHTALQANPFQVSIEALVRFACKVWVQGTDCSDDLVDDIDSILLEYLAKSDG